MAAERETSGDDQGSGLRGKTGWRRAPDWLRLVPLKMRLVQPQRRLVQPQRRLVQPQRRLVQPQRRLVQPQRRLVPMGSIMWERDMAEVYDQTYRAKFEPSVLDPMIDLLAGLARGGPALEFALGTGRVALPLSARGVAVHGLELSPYMAAQLRAKPGAEAIPVTIGDMTTRVPARRTPDREADGAGVS
jgi:hypothetical protein